MFTAVKSGELTYIVRQESTGLTDTIFPENRGVTMSQYNKMVKNPDMILQFAREVEKDYTDAGIFDVRVYCDSYVSLNGRERQRFIHPNINLLDQRRTGLEPYPFIVPLKENRRD